MATRLSGSRTQSQSSGSPRGHRSERGALLGFDLYFDKGIKKIVKDWGETIKEGVNQAIMDGYRDAFIKAKRAVAEEMLYSGNKVARPSVSGLPPTDESAGRVFKPGERAKNKFPNMQLVDKTTNKTADVSGVQRIWDSLGYTMMEERGRYITATAGSADWDDTGYGYSGITARSAPGSSLAATTERKPPGGFNLAEYYEDGLSRFQYNFKDIGDRPGITPSKSYMWDVKPGLVTLVKKAWHPGFKDIGAVYKFRENFVEELEKTVTLKLFMRGITEFNGSGKGMI